MSDVKFKGITVEGGEGCAIIKGITTEGESIDLSTFKGVIVEGGEALTGGFAQIIKKKRK
jgi:hypothetical protein